MLSRQTKLIVVALVPIVLGACTSVDSSTRPGYNFQEVRETAVVDVSGDFEGKSARGQVADYIDMELLKRGYLPIEREKIQKVLGEQEFQQSDRTRQEDAVRAGQILNVPTVVMATARVNGERIDMTIKMVDVSDGRILWVGSGSGKTGRVLTTIGGAAVGATAGILLGGDSTGRTVGGAAGGVLGGVAGQALTPDVAQTVKKVVKRIVSTLPQRGIEAR